MLYHLIKSQNQVQLWRVPPYLKQIMTSQHLQPQRQENLHQQRQVKLFGQKRRILKKILYQQHHTNLFLLRKINLHQTQRELHRPIH